MHGTVLWHYLNIYQLNSCFSSSLQRKILDQLLYLQACFAAESYREDYYYCNFQTEK